MSVSRPSLSPNTTIISSTVDSGYDTETIKAQNVKDLLKSRIFLGRYLERRLVDERVGYRDIILLSAAEQELKKDLLDAQHNLRTLFPSIPWIGITDGTAIGYSGICLWTEIDNQPFGAFWFQIRSVKFRDDEIILTVRCIRHITEAFLELEPILTGATTKASVVKSSAVNNAALNESYSEIIETLKSALSISNFKEFITFLCAFVIAVFSGSTAFINFLGNFVLALIREMSYFVKNSTPLFLGFLDFISKIVGGFYILIAMFLKPSNSGVPPPTRRPLRYYEQNRRPSITYNEEFDPKSFD